jgi:hypothetical protein
MVCNLAVLASALFKFSDTRPDGTIYSSRGRRVGVIRHQLPSINFAPGRTGDDGINEGKRPTSVVLSQLHVTIDPEFGDVSTTSMNRTQSPSPPPPTTILDGQRIDSRV